MRISALEEYGLRCLLTLAKEGLDSQLSISDIAEKEGLSIPYASKLLSILRKAKLVKAVRGRSGGFCISRPPENINVLEVITALGGPLIEPGHCDKFSGQLETCVHLDRCSVKYVLSGLAGYVGDFLSNTTLVDVLNGNILERVKRIESNVALKGNSIIEHSELIDKFFEQKNSELIIFDAENSKEQTKKDL